MKRVPEPLYDSRFGWGPGLRPRSNYADFHDTRKGCQLGIGSSKLDSGKGGARELTDERGRDAREDRRDACPTTHFGGLKMGSFLKIDFVIYCT